MAVRVAQRFVFLPLFAFGGCSDSNPPPNKQAENVGFLFHLSLRKKRQEKPLFFYQILEFFTLTNANEEEKKGASFWEEKKNNNQKSIALLHNSIQRERERERETPLRSHLY